MISWQYFSATAAVLFIFFGIWHIEAYIKTIIVVFFILYGIPPLVWHYSIAIQKHFLFLNLVNEKHNSEFNRPEAFGLEGCRNFHLYNDEQMKIGIWQLLPLSLATKMNHITDEDFDTALEQTERPVFIYIHGKGGDRANKNRIGLYKVLQKLDYNVITFDYRGYGDSDHADFSEAGVVADSKFVVQWVMKKVKSSMPIFIWGHSLGTGISTNAVAQLAADNIHPAGLILESPFNNIADALREVSTCQIIKHLPWFHWSIIEPIYRNNLRFESEKHIKNIKCPVMIIHAGDDNVVPIELGVKLFEAGLESRNNTGNKIEMMRIDEKFGCGHNCIYRYDQLSKIIKTFLSTSLHLKYQSL